MKEPAKKRFKLLALLVPFKVPLNLKRSQQPTSFWLQTRIQVTSAEPSYPKWEVFPANKNIFISWNKHPKNKIQKESLMKKFSTLAPLAAVLLANSLRFADDSERASDTPVVESKHR